MIRTILNDEQWKQIAPELPGKVGDPGVTARNNRLFPLTWVVRGEVEPRYMKGPIEAELRAATGGLPVARTRTMEQVFAGPARRCDTAAHDAACHAHAPLRHLLQT